jgi:metal-dependent HD superfamily phosphatase/phosphodiesterase
VSEAPSQDNPLALELLKQDPELSVFIASADRVMEGMGYTEHGFRHANLVANISYNVLDRLGFGEHASSLAGAAGYLHDVGNMATREAHGQIGSVFVYQVLSGRADPEDLAVVIAAIANHEEPAGPGVSEVAAAVILADKADVHRSRVRDRTDSGPLHIHDRVNYAAEESFLRVDSAAKTITLELTIDTTISTVMEYFEIFLQRMTMCRHAAEKLGCAFRLTINGADLL